jgi:hypothetical protein
MFNWNLCDDQEEVVSELCSGLPHLKKDNLLTFVCSIIYTEGFEFKEMSKRIEEVDGAVFSVEDEDKRIFDNPSEDDDV